MERRSANLEGLSSKYRGLEEDHLHLRTVRTVLVLTVALSHVHPFPDLPNVISDDGSVAFAQHVVKRFGIQD